MRSLSCCTPIPRSATPIAQELIDFDSEWAKMFMIVPAKDPASDDADGVDPKEFQKYFEHARPLTRPGWVRTTCRRSSAAQATHQQLATGFVIGTRFHSAPVVRVADARPVQLGHAGKADGRWRLYAFADARPPGRCAGIAAPFLADSPDSPVRTYTRPGEDIDALFDLRAVFQQGHRELAVEISCRDCCCRARGATGCATTRRSLLRI